jgi:hypothetical protein
MLPSIEQLRKLFDYDPVTGVLTHRNRLREAFPSKRAWLTWQTRYAGKPAGWKNKDAWTVTVTDAGIKHKILAHRLIWAIAHGCWPAEQIDHRNGNPSDNRLDNIREATRAENGQNLPPVSTRGTCFDGSTRGLKRRWRAYIKVDKKQRWLGAFATREEAHAAYLTAKAKLHSFQPVPREMGNVDGSV